MAKVQPCTDREDEVTTGYMFWCPGCEEHHQFMVAPGKPSWTFNGDVERPTVEPSILVSFTLYGPDKTSFRKYDGPMPCEASKGVCHSFITDGRIRFLDDCTHHLKGQTVDLPDIE